MVEPLKIILKDLNIISGIIKASIMAVAKI
jgi:hypothetical protein